MAKPKKAKKKAAPKAVVKRTVKKKKLTIKGKLPSPNFFKGALASGPT